MDFLFGAPPRVGGFHVKNHHFLKMWKFLTENTTWISHNPSNGGHTIRIGHFSQVGMDSSDFILKMPMRKFTLSTYVMQLFHHFPRAPPPHFSKKWKVNLTSSMTYDTYEPLKRSPVILLQFNQTQKKIASTQSCLSNSSGFRSIRAFFTELCIIWHCTPLIDCAPQHIPPAPPTH